MISIAIFFSKSLLFVGLRGAFRRVKGVVVGVVVAVVAARESGSEGIRPVEMMIDMVHRVGVVVAGVVEAS